MAIGGENAVIILTRTQTTSKERNREKVVDKKEDVVIVNFANIERDELKFHSSKSVYRFRGALKKHFDFCGSRGGCAKSHKLPQVMTLELLKRR